jgi:hypothetical protein
MPLRCGSKEDPPTVSSQMRLMVMMIRSSGSSIKVRVVLVDVLLRIRVQVVGLFVVATFFCFFVSSVCLCVPTTVLVVTKLYVT